MAVKVVKIEKETCGRSRFIGKRYTGADRVNGNFEAKWGEWWQNDWFSVLEKQLGLPINDNSYIGAMRTVNGEFEYWIGMFYSQETSVPEDFDYVDIEPMKYAVIYVQGNEEKGEVYSMEAQQLSRKALEENGWRHTEGSWQLERYNCPRYTTPDKNGNIILDWCISIEK